VEPVGAIELVHERPWASAWRLPAAAGVVWFKACAPVQAFEPRLTAALARRWPDRLPEVLAHDEERAWLLLADAGEPLGFGGDPEPWLAVLPRYAELQQGEAARAEEHLGAGVPDRRLATFPARYEALLARGDLPLEGGDRARLAAFAPRLAERCAELPARGVPETIQHDDLHGANVFPGGGTPRILDWGDSCVSHPFLTVYGTFLHLGAPRAWLARLRDAYLEPWGRPAGLRETFELALHLAPFAHLFSELRVRDAIPREQRPAHASGLRATLASCVAAAERLPRARS
jgi:hypothetical protein